AGSETAKPRLGPSKRAGSAGGRPSARRRPQVVRRVVGAGGRARPCRNGTWSRGRCQASHYPPIVGTHASEKNAERVDQRAGEGEAPREGEGGAAGTRGGRGLRAGGGV